MYEKITEFFTEYASDGMEATYSVEDDKLRLYPDGRLDALCYEALCHLRKRRREDEPKPPFSLGFTWAGKQGVFVAVWSPNREAALIALASDIEDESMSLEERQAMRAERFGEYSGNAASRSEQAAERSTEIVSHIPMGQPILVGHHSEKRHRRDLERADNAMRRAVCEMRKSNYWEDRAVGVLRYAKSKYAPVTVFNRIKRLKADIRKQERECEGLSDFEKYDLYKAVCQDRLGVDRWSIPRPSELTDEQGTEINAEMKVRGNRMLAARREQANLWIEHHKVQLAYWERIYSELDEGGKALAPTDRLVKGAFVRARWGDKGWLEIVRVNKARDGDISSVTVKAMRKRYDAASNTLIPYDGTRVVKYSDIKETRTAEEHAGSGEFSEQQMNERRAETDAVIGCREKYETRQAEVEALEAKREKVQETRGSEVHTKATDLFSTPPDVVRQMIGLAGIEPDMRLLEPHAGTGRILCALRKQLHTITDWCEIDPGLRTYLETQGLSATQGYGPAIAHDFLAFDGNGHKYDRVVMNPPFHNGVYADHVMHAYELLRPGGRVVTIVLSNFEWADNGKPKRFREWLNTVNVTHHEILPRGTFKDEGTGVETVLLVIDKPGYRPQQRQAAFWVLETGNEGGQ